MSSCLSGGGGRAYGLDLNVLKPSPSSSLSSSLTGASSPSFTLSESSNSPPRTISIKKARAPRKRPNQTYNEAAALLSAIYPDIFPAESPKTPSIKDNPFYSLAEPPEFLPPFPVLTEAAVLIREHSPEKLSVSVDLKSASPVHKSCTSSPWSPVDKSCTSSPTSNELREPVLPSPLDDDFDAESILDEEVEEGIDSIMGNLSMGTTTDSSTSVAVKSTNSSNISPYLRDLLGFQLGSKFELGLGLRFARNLHRSALRQRDDSEWWRLPAVPIQEIVPKLKPSTAAATQSDKKKKKKVENKGEVAVKDQERITTAKTASVPLKEKLKTTGLGLKLNHEDVIQAWSGQGSIFSEDPDSPNSSAELLAKLADIDLFEDGSGLGGVREASVLRYKEKRRTRLFSKKIRYHVRKANADTRPRIKGRFVRSPS